LSSIEFIRWTPWLGPARPGPNGRGIYRLPRPLSNRPARRQACEIGPACPEEIIEFTRRRGDAEVIESFMIRMWIDDVAGVRSLPA
jgi:hypothetical protein